MGHTHMGHIHTWGTHTQDTHVHTCTHMHTHMEHTYTHGVHTHTHSSLWEHLFDANVTTSSREDCRTHPWGSEGDRGPMAALPSQ